MPKDVNKKKKSHKFSDFSQQYLTKFLFLMKISLKKTLWEDTYFKGVINTEICKSQSVEEFLKIPHSYCKSWRYN